MAPLRRAPAAPYVYRRRRLTGEILILLMISALAVCAVCTLGTAKLSFSDIFAVLRARLHGVAAENRTADIILLSIRLPRALLSYIVGAALAVSGACMQGVFKNPMAEPGLLGVSAGAAIGAAFAMILELESTFLGFGVIPVCAFIGGTLAVLLVLGISRTGGRTSTIALLLSGIAVSAFLSAMLTGLLTLNRDKMETVYLWTMGSFTASSWDKVGLALPVTILGTVLLRLLARELNAMQMGEAEARLLGVSVERLRALALGIATLVTATAVSLSGVIGFVGLMAPHAVRALSGPDHRSLIPLSALAGGLFLLFADTLARTIIMPMEMPVGVVTSFFGGPFFLILLKRSRAY